LRQLSGRESSQTQLASSVAKVSRHGAPVLFDGSPVLEAKRGDRRTVSSSAPARKAAPRAVLNESTALRPPPWTRTNARLILSFLMSRGWEGKTSKRCRSAATLPPSVRASAAVGHGAAFCGTCAPPLEEIPKTVISPAVTDTIHV